MSSNSTFGIPLQNQAPYLPIVVLVKKWVVTDKDIPTRKKDD